MTAREELEAHLAHLHQLLSQFETLVSQEAAVYREHDQRYLRPQERWGAGRYLLLVLVLTALLSVAAVIVSMILFRIGAAMTAGGGAESWILAMLLPVLMPLPIALVLAAVLLKIRNAKVPAQNERRQIRNEEISKDIEVAVAPQTARIRKEIARVRGEFRAAGFLGWFPEKYLTTEDVAACWEIVHDHRASTVQEVINVYRSDLHEAYMRDSATAQLAEQERATRVAMFGNIINAAGHASTQATIRAEGAATRAAMPTAIRIR